MVQNYGTEYSISLPILDTLQKMTNSLLVNVDIPIRLVRISLYPSKIEQYRLT